MEGIEQKDDPNMPVTMSASQNKFLITELDTNVSSSEYNSEEDEDIDDLIIPKPAPVVYENNIFDEKDWDTDLEGI